MPNLADEVFRDFVRFTGDGLPNEPVGHGLPVGDPRSGVHNPGKKPIRDAMRGAFEASTDVQGATLFAGSLAALQANTDTGTGVGTLFMTRQEGAVMRVLDPSDTRPHLVTAGGVKMAVERWDRDDRGALAQIGLKAQAGEAVRIAVMGDSTAVGGPPDVVQPYNNWPTRMGSILRAMMGGGSTLVTYNCGSNGKKVIDWWAWDNFQAMVETPYPLAEYVMLGFGLNDIKSDEAPAWDPTLFKQRYAYLINRIRLSGRIPILVAPILISAAAIRPNLLIQGQLLNAVRELADEIKVDLIDFNKAMQDWQRDRTDQYRIAEYQPDGTHPTDDVYVFLAGYACREIMRHLVIDVSHGSRLGPHNARYAPGVTVAYNRTMNNAWGFSARLTAVGDVTDAAGIWVWSDRARKVVYVSPDRSVVSGGGMAAVYSGWHGGDHTDGVMVDFGAAASGTVDRPAENHLYVADLRVGLSWLRFRTPAAGVFEFGGWLILDKFAPASVSAYSTEATAKELFLPEFHDSRPEVVAYRPGGVVLALDGSIPVGWGVVIGTQYVFDGTAGPGIVRRKQSIVVLRTATGADILRVVSSVNGVIPYSIKTSGSGPWAGLITIQCNVSGGNAQVIVRADGTIIANYTSGGTGEFRSPYGRLGGLYRDPALVTDPVGRQAVATLVPMPV